MSVDIARVIQEIKEEASIRRTQPLHSDRDKLDGKSIRIRPVPVPFRKKALEVISREQFGALRRTYRLPVIGYLLKLVVSIVRLPIRLQQLGNELQELSEIRSLLFETDERTRSATMLSLDTREMIQSLKSRLSEAGPNESVTTILAEQDEHALDNLYFEFEKRFRGSQTAIRAKQEHYLPFFDNHKFNFKEELVLDVGCGRGEWLELLQTRQYRAVGLDLNRVMISECKAKGLNVELMDVVTFLKGQATGSLGALTGFHIVEHLPFKDLIEIMDQTFRALKPGGMVILETPNPENIVTAACNFYVDPTHRNPIPYQALSFFLEQRGFVSLQVEKLSPLAKKLNSSDPLVEDLAAWFYREQDYGIVAYKP